MPVYEYYAFCKDYAMCFRSYLYVTVQSENPRVFSVSSTVEVSPVFDSKDFPQPS